MDKKYKIIQINGLSGLLLLGLLASGLFFGFIVFPVWGIMKFWNLFIATSFHWPTINFMQSSLLLAVVILFFYPILRESIAIKIDRDDILNPTDIKNIVPEIKEKELEHKESRK